MFRQLNYRYSKMSFTSSTSNVTDVKNKEGPASEGTVVWQLQFSRKEYI